MLRVKALAAGLALAGWLWLVPSEAQVYRVAAQLVAEGLTAPLAMASLPDGRFLVLEQVGLLRIVEADGRLRPEPFLDLRDRLDPTIADGFDERGALGLALHPEFASNGRLYLFYSGPLRAEHDLTTTPEWGAHTSRVAEFRVMPSDPGRADPASERLLLEIDKSQFAHNGGSLVFGPDGMLYISLGDGGSAPENGDYPIEGTSQHGDTLLGKILRIDVDRRDGPGGAYGIPADNPFLGKPGYRPEIFALGFRNPFRISIDQHSGLIYAGDVGQNAYEEIDLVEAGRNYGWAIKEGTHCFDWGNFEGHHDRCDSRGLTDPIIEYKNGGKFPEDSQGRSTVGGVIYRGGAMPALQGKLVFADWGKDGGEPSGVTYVATPGDVPQARWSFEPLALVAADGFAHFILSLAEDRDHELYLLTSDSQAPDGPGGKIFKLVPASATAAAGTPPVGGLRQDG